MAIAGYESKTYYELLGVSREASSDQISRAYREIAKVYHPDSNFFSDIIETPLTERDKEIFRLVTEAYEILSDPGRRAEYDRELALAATKISKSSFEEREAPVVPRPDSPSTSPPAAHHEHSSDASHAVPSNNLRELFKLFVTVLLPVVVVLAIAFHLLFR